MNTAPTVSGAGPLPPDGGGSDDILLSTDRLTKNYKLTAANRDVSLSIPRGRIVGFVGENGSGKTTFIRMITGLILPTSGSFRYHTANGSCRIGAIVESPSLYQSLNAEDNLRCQAKLCGADGSKIPEILSLIGLQDAGKKTAKQFSLGMRQRLGIGMALISDPELLILDEPTNGLDPQGIIELRALIKKLCTEKKITVLISSHILSELSLLAEHYFFIRKGEILQSLTAEELSGRLSRQLIFRCGAAPAAFLQNAVAKGWADRATERDGAYCLHEVHDYPSVLRELAFLDVSFLETREETLETYYLSLMKGGVQA